MGDFFAPVWPNLGVITPFHPESLGIGAALTALYGDTAGVGALVQNEAYFYPFTLWHPDTAVKMGVVIGSTSSGNLDVGIYDSAWHKLVSSGSTATGTASALQEIDITDTLLLPGRYFMAFQVDNITGTFYRTVPADEAILGGYAPIYSQAVGSFGLPTTAAPAVTTVTSPPLIAMGVWFDTLL